MDCSQVTAGIEMTAATADNKGVLSAGITKAGKDPAQAILSDFKKKLESLTAAAQPAAVTAEPVIMPGQDLSMAINTAAQAVPDEVVGILEGFGLLDYQTEISAAISETSQTQGAVKIPVEAAQQAQMSGQFARMLHNEQPGDTAQNAPAQTNAGAGEYSGSLESTNSTATAANEAVLAESQDATMLLKSKLTVENKPQASASTPVQKQPQQAVPAESAEVAKDQTAQTQPQHINGEQLPVEKEAVKLSSTSADALPENTVNAGAETAKVSTQQAEAPPAEPAEPQKATTDFVKDNVIRIVDKARASIGEGRYEFDVDLKPDFLGKVSIKLTMENGEVRMHVQTEDAAVKGLFSDHSGSLQSALKEKGIVISTVDVSYQEQMAAGREAFGQQSGGNGQRREGHIGWGADRYSGSELFEASVPVSELLGGSSVEYLA